MKLELITNQIGESFFEKWRKETWQGLILFAPIMLAFYWGIGTVIVGFTLKLVLISILPTVIVVRSFISPYYARKKYVNQSIRKLSINDDKVQIETFPWFKHPPIIAFMDTAKIEIVKVDSYSFFRGEKLHILRIRDSLIDGNQFYIPDDFFDNIDDFFAIFKT